MPSHDNCCVPLCTNHSRKIEIYHFIVFQRTKVLERTTQGQSETKHWSWNPLTLEFVPHILKEVRRNIPGNCRLSFHGVNPVKKGNYLQGGRLVLTMFCQELISLLTRETSLIDFVYRRALCRAFVKVGCAYYV